MQANTPWEMLPSRQRTRSAPRNSTRFAAQYSARGLPCERFTAVLTDRTSCITRGRGGWLDLPRGGLAPPIPCQLSWRALVRVILRPEPRVTSGCDLRLLGQRQQTGRSGCPNEKTGAARGYSRDLGGAFGEHDELDCFICVSSPGLTGRPGNVTSI